MIDSRTLKKLVKVRAGGNNLPSHIKREGLWAKKKKMARWRKRNNAAGLSGETSIMWPSAWVKVFASFIRYARPVKAAPTAVFFTKSPAKMQ